MKPAKVRNYESILQALGEPGCPFCAFMKNLQASLVQESAQKQIQNLCNFHTWSIAATQSTLSAAQIFLDLLEKPAAHSSECDICVHIEENRRIREFRACLQYKLAAQWLRSSSILCMTHGRKLKEGASPILASTIDTITERHRNQLIETLKRIQTNVIPIHPNGACWDMRPNSWYHNEDCIHNQ